MSATPIRVLFVCTGNSARSQIAEALLARVSDGDFEVFSAGIVPVDVSPYAVRALAEAGIDWSQAESKTIDRFLSRQFDYVITVCDRARQTCPPFPGSYTSLHWGLEDPDDTLGTDEEQMAAYRRSFMEISLRVRPFVEVALRDAGRARHAVLADSASVVAAE